jgi:hypothetical protein
MCLSPHFDEKLEHAGFHGVRVEEAQAFRMRV